MQMGEQSAHGHTARKQQNLNLGARASAFSYSCHLIPCLCDFINFCLPLSLRQPGYFKLSVRTSCFVFCFLLNFSGFFMSSWGFLTTASFILFQNYPKYCKFSQRFGCCCRLDCGFNNIFYFATPTLLPGIGSSTQNELSKFLLSE